MLTEQIGTTTISEWSTKPWGSLTVIPKSDLVIFSPLGACLFREKKPETLLSKIKRMWRK